MPPATEPQRRPELQVVAEPVLSITCEDCVMRASEHCADCVVTYLLDEQRPSTPVTLDERQTRTVRLLADAGLVPGLRFELTG